MPEKWDRKGRNTGLRLNRQMWWTYVHQGLSRAWQGSSRLQSLSAQQELVQNGMRFRGYETGDPTRTNSPTIYTGDNRFRILVAAKLSTAKELEAVREHGSILSVPVALKALFRVVLLL